MKHSIRDFRYNGSSDNVYVLISVLVFGLAIVIAPIVGYVMNVSDVITKPQYQTMTVPNVVCGIGTLPVPPVFLVGSVCGFVRD